MDTINPAIEPAKMFAKLTGASLSVAYVLPSRAFHEIQVPVERKAGICSERRKLLPVMI
ncbi:MAG: hypothetical protein V8Q84_12630 [Bilophila sp.]